MTSYRLRSVVLLAAVLVACSPDASEPAPNAAGPEAAADSAAPPASAPAAVSAITAVGTITAINPEAGTVTLDHEAIPAVQWGAMTMQFTTEPALLTGLKVGDTVSFELKSASETTTIVKIDKR